MERFTYAGRWYAVRDAPCEPKAVQRPLPPIWMGETNNPAMVRAIARHADVFNSMPVSTEGLRRKLAVLEEACRGEGRDVGTLGRSLETQVLIARSDAEIDACFARMERPAAGEAERRGHPGAAPGDQPRARELRLAARSRGGVPDRHARRRRPARAGIRGPRCRPLHAVVHGFPEPGRDAALRPRGAAAVAPGRVTRGAQSTSVA